MAPTKNDRDDLLFFNGIDGSTGDYGLPPMSGAEFSRRIAGQPSPENLAELKGRAQKGQGHYGVREGVDPKKLEEAGWGVVFAHDADPALREALSPLLELRRRQAGDRFRIYGGAAGLRPQESKSKFLARHGAGPGPADPARVPYYLLLVGDPQTISYRFQSQLDVQYAVGRISFDRLEEYANYAQSVVRAERGESRRCRQLSFFGVEHPDDPATGLSVDGLVVPLLDHLRRRSGDWQVDALLRGDAGKAGLERLLGSRGGRPALLFTASHGMEFPQGDPRQLAHQGALLCGDWPGPKQGRGPIPQDYYLAADDLGAGADLLGLIGFFFACYGAGTPELDDFAKQAFAAQRARIAPFPFLAALPQRMLGHPQGGALAVVGHVDRAWGYSFAWQKAGFQTAVFESTLDRLLDGHPIGSALEFFNERYAELSTVLSDQLEEIEFGAIADPYELAGLWTASNDARGYLLMGDPAVRLAAPDDLPPRSASLGSPVKGGLGLDHGGSRDFDFDDQLLGAPPDRPKLDKGPGGQLSYTVGEGDERAIESAAAPASVAAAKDEVSFSAYPPRALEAGATRKLLVYLHLEAVLRQVEDDAAGRHGQAAPDFRRSEAKKRATLAAGTEVLLVPQGEGVVFEPPEARLTWSPPWQRAEFEVTATGERAGHVCEASIGCYVGPLLIAEIRLPIVLVAPGEEAPAEEEEAEPAVAKPYQAIFASYSHADTALVKAMEKAYEALGMDYLRDVMKLKAGQDWSAKLLEMIDQADIFQLFWSQTASQSAYVEQEWRRALQIRGKKGAAFIRPLCWEQPMPKVPRELSRIHFASVEISPLGALIPAAAAKPPEAPKERSVKTYAGGQPGNLASGRLVAWTRITPGGDLENWFDPDAEATYLDQHHASVRAALAAN